jgi:hypothetical protein
MQRVMQSVCIDRAVEENRNGNAPGQLVCYVSSGVGKANGQNGRGLSRRPNEVLKNHLEGLRG